MFIDSNVTKVFFTSDTHFGHRNIIKYCNRPYQNIDEMHSEMIMNWNRVVGEDDIVFHLGDFSFMKEWKDINELIWSLNGQIYLIPGNHDNVNLLSRGELAQKFNILSTLQEVDIQVEDEKLRFVLCHYAMRVWNKSHYGAIHLYGHSHGTLPDDATSRSMDVGADCNKFTPISIDDILLMMYRKVFKAVDHHKDRT